MSSMQNGTAKILVVDDEPDILEFLSYNLAREGYEVETAQDGLEALKKARKNVPDLMVLDIMMPRMDGIAVCEELRADSKFNDTLILFLTARGDEQSEITGLHSGADDYLAKPIKPRLLLSRVQALLRRSTKPTSDILKVNDLEINREKYIVTYKEEQLSLPRKEFELLSLLASQPGKVFNRDEIMTRVWGNEVIVGDRTIDVHIRKLRQKLSDEAIATVKGVGYKLEV